MAQKTGGAVYEIISLAAAGAASAEANAVLDQVLNYATRRGERWNRETGADRYDDYRQKYGSTVDNLFSSTAVPVEYDHTEGAKK